MKSFLIAYIIRPLAVCQVFLQAFLARIKLTLFHQREWAIGFIGRPILAPTKTQKVLVFVAHIIKPEEVSDPKCRETKVSRLRETLLGLLRSLSDFELTIELHTMKGRSVAEDLPDFIKSRVIVNDQYQGDPMLLEFEAQETFKLKRNQYDWFMAIEDDIVIYDSLFIQKIECFNEATHSARILLQPHRFEMRNGEKKYFDLQWRVDGASFSWNSFATFGLNQVQFGECGNPHAGMYCINRDQLDLWNNSGRHWKGKVVMVGELESAMSGCLFEVFRVYKSHPSNLSYFEVQHWDEKYSSILEKLPKQI